MDGTRFDDLTRRLGQGIVSRRWVLRAAAGGAAALLLAGGEHDEGAARRHRHRRCRHGKQRCFGACIDPQTDPNNCGGCAIGCSTLDQACCDGTCQNIVDDRINCGACFFGCAVGEDCCGTRCFNLSTSVQHCGSCRTDCGPHALCDHGVCTCDDASGRCPGPAAQCCPLSCSCRADGTCPCR